MTKCFVYFNINLTRASQHCDKRERARANVFQMSKELIVVQNEMFYDGQILVHAAEGTERIQTPGLNLSNPE